MISPRFIHRKLVRAYIRKHTGTLVSENRISRWIAVGELRTARVPRRCGGRDGLIYVTKESLDKLIARYST